MPGSKNKWTSEEERILGELKRGGRSTGDIIEMLRTSFGTSRTASSIHTKYHQMNHDGKRTVSPKEARREETSYAHQQLQEYDKENVIEVLKRREEFLYKLMAEQAEAIKVDDSLLRYEGLKLEDLMALDLSKRREITRLLENPPKPKVKEVPILHTRSSGTDFALVLPVYFVDAQGESGKSLASCINDSVIGFMFGEGGFKAKASTKDRLRDLVRYNVQGQLNLKSFEGSVSDLVKREYNKVNRVYLLENRLGFLTHSETD